MEILPAPKAFKDKVRGRCIFWWFPDPMWGLSRVSLFYCLKLCGSPAKPGYFFAEVFEEMSVESFKRMEI